MTSPLEWVKFFEGAEIPRVSALEYAVTFADQRMSFDMLADLDKEYLRDMGITRTGDVINILKHAKVFDARLAAQKVTKSSPPVPEEPKKKPPTNAVKSLPTVRQVKTVAETPKPENKKVTVAPEPPVTQRLGPPVAKPFVVPQRQTNAEKHGVFKRLGAPTKETNEKGEESSFRPSLTGEKSKTVQTPLNEASSLKRKPAEAQSLGKVESYSDYPEVAAPVYAKRRLVLVKTLPDGSKTKEVISPDDPIVQRIPVHKVIVPRLDPTIDGPVRKSSSLRDVDELDKPSHSSNRSEMVSIRDRLSPRPPSDPKSRLGPPKTSSLPRSVGGVQARLAPRQNKAESTRKEFRRVTPPRDCSTIKTSASLANRLGTRHVSKDERVVRERSPHGRSHHHQPAYQKTKSVRDRLG